MTTAVARDLNTCVHCTHHAYIRAGLDALARIQAAASCEIYGETCNDLFKSTHTHAESA